MIPRAELAPNSGAKEREPKHKVQVIFLGIDHYPLNLQRITPISGPLSHPGRRILFAEGDYNPASSYWQEFLLYKNFGLPNFDEFDHEKHTLRVTRRLKSLRDLSESIIEDSGIAWYDGQFERFLKFIRMHEKIEFDLMELREKDIISQLKRLTKRLLRQKDGGMIVMIFGAGHEGMLDDLQRELGEALPIAYTKLFLTSIDDPGNRITRAWRNKEDIPDELYAQKLLAAITGHILEGDARNSQNLTAFGQHYQDIDGVLIQFANSFTLDEIRRICEERQNIEELLRGHPLAEPIRQWLDF